MQAMNSKRFYYVVAGTTTDDQHPLLQIRYIGTNPYHELKINKDGTNSALLFYLNEGASGTDYSQYQFGAHSSGAADDGIGAGAVDSSPTYLECDTLQALVNGVNALTGWEARRAEGPAEFSLATDDFIDIGTNTGAGIPIPRTWYSCLYRDTTEYATDIDAGHIATCRIASPDYGIWTPSGPGDSTRVFGSNQGKIEVVRIDGYIDSGTTAGILDMYQDQGTATDGSDRVHVAQFISGNTTAVVENFLDREPGKGIVAHGPLYFTVSSATNDEPDAVDLSILWRAVD